MPQNFFDDSIPQEARIPYASVRHRVNSRLEFSNCILSALRAKLRNPKDVKIHVIPSLGDGKMFPHVFWEETGKNGKRYFRDFWHDQKKFEARGFVHKNRIFGVEPKSLERLPINFEGRTRVNIAPHEILGRAASENGGYFRGQLESGALNAMGFHRGLAIAAKRNRKGIYGILAALAAGSTADHAMNAVIKNDSDYTGYRGGIGKNVGTGLGLVAGAPIGLHLGLLPQFNNMMNYSVRTGKFRPKEIIPVREFADGGRLKPVAARLNAMLNGTKYLPKGKARALAAMLAATGVAVPTVLGRMAGRTLDAGAKGISYAVHRSGARHES